MLKRHSQVFEGLFTASDLMVVSLAWASSYWLRFWSGLIEVDKGIPPVADYMRMLIFVWLIWAFVFRRFGLYRPMRGVNRLREAWLVVRANSLSVILLMAVTYLFREKSVEFSRLVFVIFWCSSTVLAVCSRSAVRSFLRAMRRRGYNLRYVLIVGAGDLAQRVARRMRKNPEFGLELVGCLAGDASEITAKPPREAFPARREDISRQKSQGGISDSYSPEYSMPWLSRTKLSQQFRTAGRGNLAVAMPDKSHSHSSLPVVGIYTDLSAFIEKGWIDQIIIALPHRDHHRMEDVIATIGDAIVDVKIVPDVYQFIQLGSEVEEFDGLPVISLASTPLCGINRVAKRIFDLIFGPLLFLVFSPLLLLIGLLVKLSSRGPVFFTQERVGLDGKKFNIYKFRTMRLDAESNGAQFAVANDPRVTTLGRVLRKLSLDELPQLFNVIRGQMSLVGPRPERPVFITEFRRRIPRYMLRHKVQAGMTGWAQVNGWRGNTSIEKRIEHDLFYIENWSIALDLKILFLTLLKAVRDRNAY